MSGLIVPEVLNRKDFPGRLPPNTILIDRTTIFGNPFYLGSRERNCDDFECWLLAQEDERAVQIMKTIGKLRERHLMCHCAPLRCHGLTLRRLANPHLFSAGG